MKQVKVEYDRHERKSRIQPIMLKSIKNKGSFGASPLFNKEGLGVIEFKSTARRMVFAFILSFSFLVIPHSQASILDSIKNLFFKDESSTTEAVKLEDSLIKPSLFVYTRNVSPLSVDAATLSVQSGPMRMSTEEEVVTNDIITNYEVKEGDTLASIAKLFNVSKYTITYANDLKGKEVKVGDTLLIFPITGIQYTVKSGATVTEIANKYKVDAGDLAEYNGLAVDSKLSKGDSIFIPDVEENVTENKKENTNKKPVVKKYAVSTVDGYYMKPVNGCVRTQGLHGHNGLDFGCRVGTPILASAAGTVIAAKSSGYNGGYGLMVIVAHPNGTQTLYAHLSSLSVSAGDRVVQGQIIGGTGNTGRSTGPHLHFEVRGARNPF